MARETVFRCDFHGEFVPDAEVTRLLARPGTATTQSYVDPVDICPPCAARVTVTEALAKMAERQAARLPAEPAEVVSDEQQQPDQA